VGLINSGAARHTHSTAPGHNTDPFCRRGQQQPRSVQLLRLFIFQTRTCSLHDPFCRRAQQQPRSVQLLRLFILQTRTCSLHGLKFACRYLCFGHAHMHTCTQTQTHRCTHAHMHTMTHTHTHAQTCTHMHTHAHTCTHMHTCTHTHTGAPTPLACCLSMYACLLTCVRTQVASRPAGRSSQTSFCVCQLSI
jgi:hypothetical protein